MGKLALAAKITHVPSMYLSELPGPHQGCRQAAIDGHVEIGRRCRALGVDTIVVFDVHWLVNADYHINCAPHFKGIYTSNELPHFIKNMPYEYPGNPGARPLIGEARQRGRHQDALARRHDARPRIRHAGADALHERATSTSRWCRSPAGAMWHDLRDSVRFGAAVRRAIEDRYDGTVAIFASGSLSHHFADNGTAEQYMHRTYNEFLLQHRPRGRRDVEGGRVGGVPRHAADVQRKVLGRGRHARHGDAAGRARRRALRPAAWRSSRRISAAPAPGRSTRSFPSCRLPREARYPACRTSPSNIPANLRATATFGPLCAALARTLMAQQADGKPVYPVGGIRVRALARGRLVHRRRPRRCGIRSRAPVGRRRAQRSRPAGDGDALFAVMKAHFAELFERQGLALSLEIGEFSGAGTWKHNNLHARMRGT